MLKWSEHGRVRRKPETLRRISQTLDRGTHANVLAAGIKPELWVDESSQSDKKEILTFSTPSPSAPTLVTALDTDTGSFYPSGDVFLAHTFDMLGEKVRNEQKLDWFVLLIDPENNKHTVSVQTNNRSTFFFFLTMRCSFLQMRH